ncbi:hypothetical protein NE237_031032 [Protea cynaroides]|uniref:Uncharacterized protein n=1 Tax=Protea cynaroides TaxID=273540 RepID=A0A9Q0JXI0_9MAGN|nr:hypothetical protein NE237_031032 [Protea cynaroides]
MEMVKRLPPSVLKKGDDEAIIATGDEFLPQLSLLAFSLDGHIAISAPIASKPSQSSNCFKALQVLQLCFAKYGSFQAMNMVHVHILRTRFKSENIGQGTLKIYHFSRNRRKKIAIFSPIQDLKSKKA